MKMEAMVMWYFVAQRRKRDRPNSDFGESDVRSIFFQNATINSISVSDVSKGVHDTKRERILAIFLEKNGLRGRAARQRGLEKEYASKPPMRAISSMPIRQSLTWPTTTAVRVIDACLREASSEAIQVSGA